MSDKYDCVHSYPDMFDIFVDIYPVGACGYTPADVLKEIERLKREAPESIGNGTTSQKAYYVLAGLKKMKGLACATKT